MTDPTKEIDLLLKAADELALKYVEHLARKILKAHPNLDRFIMAMGVATFTTHDSDDSLGLEERRYFKPLDEFLEKFDGVLGLTGTPMMFTADGPVVTEW